MENLIVDWVILDERCLRCSPRNRNKLQSQNLNFYNNGSFRMLEHGFKNISNIYIYIYTYKYIYTYTYLVT